MMFFSDFLSSNNTNVDKAEDIENEILVKCMPQGPQSSAKMFQCTLCFPHVSQQIQNKHDRMCYFQFQRHERIIIFVIIYYERKIIPSVGWFFFPESANLEWTCSRFYKIPKYSHGLKKCIFENFEQIFLLNVRRFFTQSQKSLWIYNFFLKYFFSLNVPLDN